MQVEGFKKLGDIAIVACFQELVDDLNECCCVLAGTPIWYADNHAQSDTILAATGENENVSKKDMNQQLGHASEATVLSPIQLLMSYMLYRVHVTI